MENTKRDLSLDFTKPRVPRGGQQPPSLVTPILNLSTPELNKMISTEELAVLTPNGISSVISQPNVLPSPLIPTTVNNSNNIINNTSNNFNANNTNSNNSHHHHNNGTNMNQNTRRSSSVDNKQNVRQDVDREKIEKKRERNRLAAKKCRQRKLETIDELRKTVSQHEQKIKKLELMNEALRVENEELKKRIR